MTWTSPWSSEVQEARASLYVYSFAPLAPPPDRRAEVDAYLRHLWAACERLGMGNGISRKALSTSFPSLEALRNQPFELLAGRADDRSPSGSAAYLFAKHDAVVLAVRLAGAPSAQETLDSWRRLLEGWKAATGGASLPEGMLGEALVFAASSSLSPTDVASQLEHTANEILTVCVPDEDLRLFSLTEDGLAFWEAEGDERRVLVAVAGGGNRKCLDGWLWEHDSDLPRFALYLLQGAKIRYELIVYQEDIVAIQEKRERVERALADLLGMHKRLEEEGGRLSNELLNAQSELSRAQAESAGLVMSLTLLRDLKETVDIAAHNLKHLVPSPHPDRTGVSEPLFERDLNLADWLSDQIKHHLGYLESVRDRAKEARDLTSLRLEHAGERQARLTARLTLVQATLLGALLAAPAVAEAFKDDQQFELARNEMFALMALVTAVALSVPLLVMRWYEGYSVFEYLGLTTIGACGGWLAAALTHKEPEKVLPEPEELLPMPEMLLPTGEALVSWIGMAIAGGVLFALAGRFLNRRVNGPKVRADRSD